MTATALKHILTPAANPPRQRLSRNAVITLAVVVLHIGLIWALQTGLLIRTAELLVPAEVPDFRTWCYQQFSRLYRKVLRKVFSELASA